MRSIVRIDQENDAAPYGYEIRMRNIKTSPVRKSNLEGPKIIPETVTHMLQVQHD